MTATIATFLCVDDSTATSSQYPNLGTRYSPNERRIAYWKNILVSCATARRCVPNARLQVFTNDTADADIHGRSLHALLNELEITRVTLSFVHYLPPQGVAKSYRNIFYRFDIVRHLAETGTGTDGPVLLIDSDCLWTRPVSDLAERIPHQGLWLYSPYGERPPYLKHPHKLSRADLGAFYRQLNPAYPEPFPTYFGGEFIGGRGAAWQALQSGLQDLWLEIINTSQQQPIRLPNGKSIFDTDEYILNYVYNAHQIPITFANDFMRRVITLEGARTVKRGDTEFSLWHLPLEKTRGMMLLLSQVTDAHSAFWNTSLNEFGTYLGQYVGIPKRVYDVPRTPRQRLERFVRAPLHWLRERYMRQRAQLTQRKA